MLWAMLRIWLLALLALFAAVSRANTEVLTTIAQYTDEVCNDTTAAYMDSSWTMVSQNVSANSAGQETNCIKMLERNSYVWYYQEFWCEDSADTIRAVTQWCSSDGCDDCEVASGGYKLYINYTWNVSEYLDMHTGVCVSSDVTEYECPASTDTNNCKGTYYDSLTLTSDSRRMKYDSKELQTSFPCSYLSTAPTSAPTSSPTSEDTSFSSVELVMITVGSTIFLVGVLLLTVWRYQQHQLNKLEPWREEMHRAAREKCNGNRRWGKERVESEGLGVSAAYIIRDFMPEALAAAAVAHQGDQQPGKAPREFPLDLDNPVFHDIAPSMCFGEAAKGYGMQCPRDREPNCAVVDALNSVGKAGRATQFLSWVWSYKTKMFVRTIGAWVKQEGFLLEETFIWVCFFCNNQFRLGAENANNLEVVFEERLRSAGAIIAMLDTWKRPVYLTRCWTIFEQYIGTTLDIKIKIILPPEVMKSFTQELESGGIKQIKENLSDFDVAAARASVPEDEIKVKQLITSTIGFKAVNQTVSASMNSWCARVLKGYLEDCIVNLNEQNLSALNGTRAKLKSLYTLHHLGEPTTSSPTSQKYVADDVDTAEEALRSPTGRIQLPPLGKPPTGRIQRESKSPPSDKLDDQLPGMQVIVESNQ